jgi:hypothetical protein
VFKRERLFIFEQYQSIEFTLGFTIWDDLSQDRFNSGIFQLMFMARLKATPNSMLTGD